MILSDLIGMTGVFVLLLAFVLTLMKKLKSTSKIYALMNIFGASLSCYASFLIGYFPFVVLEATWAFVSVLALTNKVPSH